VAGGHLHRLYRHGHTPVHALPAHVKLVALVAFVLVVVATPREAFWAFAVYAGLLAAVAAVARVPLSFILRRMVVEIPFVVFALLLPFIAAGPTTQLLGVTVSQAGLLAGWNILAKGTLGVVASILLAATTDARELLLALQRLRVPPVLVEITSFMVRYADVITDEMRRMKIARESRGFDPGSRKALGVIASSAGALFIRSYERGERVHLAMLARGYAGRLPVIEVQVAGPAAWATAATLPLLALLTATVAWATT
jgi:cobalt/nickel transport system permease protein